MKTEKSTGPRKHPCGTPRQTQNERLLQFGKQRKRAYQKGKIESNSKARWEASRNKFVGKGGVPDRVENFGEVDSSEDRARARPEYVKSIRNRLRKTKFDPE